MTTHPWLTDRRAELISLSSTVLSIISLGFCLFILLTTAWVWANPKARPELDRVSFRLMLWSMVFGLGYDLCYLLLDPDFHAVPLFGPGCTAMMYWQTVTMSAVNYFCTFIGINLMFTVCFAFNPIQLRLERWYIIISLVLALGLPIIPAALGHFGHDPVYSSCYFTAVTVHARLINFVLDLYLWQTLSTLIAAGATLAALITLFRNGRATAKALLMTHNLDDEEAIISTISHETKASVSGQMSPFRRLFRRKSSESRTYRLQDRFLSIAFRVSLYPVIMIIMNVVLTVGDMVLSSTDSVDTWPKVGLFVVYYTLYGARNIFLASIGIFVDPCLWRGIKVARRSSTHHLNKPRAELTSDEGDMDFSAALASLSFSPSQIVSPETSRPPKRSEPPQYFTSSFLGVKSDSLPTGMTDDVDIDLQSMSPSASPLPPPVLSPPPASQMMQPKLSVTIHQETPRAAQAVNLEPVDEGKSAEDRRESAISAETGRTREARRGSRLRRRQEREEEEQKYLDLVHRL